MKKRSSESIFSPLQVSNKLNRVTDEDQLLENDGLMKSKLKMGKSEGCLTNCIPEEVTKDEEEVVEALNALSGVFWNNATTDTTSLDEGGLGAKSSTSTKAESLVPSLDVEKGKDELEIVNIGDGTTPHLSSSVAGTAGETVGLLKVQLPILVLFDLENTNQELKSDLKDLYINSAVQIDVFGNKKAIVIHVPHRLRKAFRKIHVRFVRELEKKFSGKDVILIATRRILRPLKKGSIVQRPRNRTLTAVHDAMLEDVVVPAEIVGKRVRYRIDGSKIMKVFLDPKERNNTEYKLETFAAVYRKLSGKDVVFEYPMNEA